MPGETILHLQFNQASAKNPLADAVKLLSNTGMYSEPSAQALSGLLIC